MQENRSYLPSADRVGVLIASVLLALMTVRLAAVQVRSVGLSSINYGEMIGLSGVSAIAKQMTEAGRCCKTIISAAQPFRTLRLAWFYVHNGYDNCR